MAHLQGLTQGGQSPSARSMRACVTRVTDYSAQFLVRHLATAPALGALGCERGHFVVLLAADFVTSCCQLAHERLLVLEIRATVQIVAQLPDKVIRPSLQRLVLDIERMATAYFQKYFIAFSPLHRSYHFHPAGQRAILQG